MVFAARPDIWTAATPVIIQEAALNGSADNRGDIYNNITLLSFLIIVIVFIYYYYLLALRPFGPWALWPLGLLDLLAIFGNIVWETLCL